MTKEDNHQEQEPIENMDLTQESTEQENMETAAEPIVELSREEVLQNELAEMNDKYIRLLAEFDNFKRRTAKERIDLLKMANADALKSMLSVLDDFDRAQKSIETAKEMDAVKEGLNLVHNKLKSTLNAQGLKEMENSIGKVFDTDMHEAITNVPASSEDMKGKVMDEVEKGYLLNEKVIRFAKVVVGA